MLTRTQLAVSGKEQAVATLRHGIESIGPFFQQRPRALRGVMDGLIRTLREIDPVAATELVPASLVKQLEELARSADPGQAQVS